MEVSAPGMATRFAGVSMVPGRITFAVMPASLFSSATVRISDTSAAFDALYAPTPAPGASAARLPMATMRPLLALRIRGITARKMWNELMRFMSNMRCKVASSVSATIVPPENPPTVWASRSIFPNREMTVSAAFFAASRLSSAAGSAVKLG